MSSSYNAPENAGFPLRFIGFGVEPEFDTPRGLLQFDIPVGQLRFDTPAGTLLGAPS